MQGMQNKQGNVTDYLRYSLSADANTFQSLLNAGYIFFSSIGMFASNVYEIQAANLRKSTILRTSLFKYKE